MNPIDRLYKKTNKTVKHTINIEDKLYSKLKQFINKNYDASFSEVLNVCIEEYILKNKITFYEKPKLESVTYRSIMIRKENLENLIKIYKKTGISVTRLVNASIKDFLEKYDCQKWIFYFLRTQYEFFFLVYAAFVDIIFCVLYNFFVFLYT